MCLYSVFFLFSFGLQMVQIGFRIENQENKTNQQISLLKSIVFNE